MPGPFRRLRVLGLVALALSVPTLPAAAPAAAVYHRPIVKVGANQSNNWSGYNQGLLEKGHQFTQVAATWTVPSATAHKAGEAEFSATWVGIGGGCVDAGCTATDATLIQAGTSQNVDASGAASYDAWWEIIPAPSVTISGLRVSAGDTIHVTIAENPPGVWAIVVQNQTSGQTFTTTTPYTSTHATAEWIEETPVVLSNSGAVTVGPLPNLTPVHFDLAQTNGGSPGLTPAEEIRLVDGSGATLATPSAPDSDADGFAVCAFASTCPAPGS